MNSLLGQRNLRHVTLIFLFDVALANVLHIDGHVHTNARGNADDPGAALRYKRSIFKFGRLGSKAKIYLPLYARVREAKNVLIADAKLIKTEAMGTYKRISYKKDGGCTRALKDFDMMKTIGVKVVDGIYCHGTLGGNSVRFISDYHGCEIRMGSKSGSGDAISVFYPENAKFLGS